MSFRDFAIDARELFGLTRAEAHDLWEILQDDGIDTDDLNVWGPPAVDYLDEVESIGDYMETFGDLEYELDRGWPWDDEWLEADEVYEVTVEYKESD